MSFSRMRPQTSQLVELHVFYVPAEVWNSQLNTVPVALNSKFISAGFIRCINEWQHSRVSPHVTLRVLWEKLGEYLGGVRVADKFKFLKCIGKKLAVGHGNLIELRLYDQIFVECSPSTFSLLFHNTNNENRTRKIRADLGEKLENQADGNKQNHLTSPKECISPPSPPLLALTLNPAQVPVIQAAKNKMEEQLQQMKKDTRHMEKTREELIKKAKGLLERNKLRRYHVPEEWKKKYFETKKATVSLEETWNKLQQGLELYHRKLLLQLEARESRERPNNKTNSKNYTIIRITTVQHELDQLEKKLDDAKMKLIIEIKMRKQAASDLRALRAELTPKIHSALILQSRRSGV